MDLTRLDTTADSGHPDNLTFSRRSESSAERSGVMSFMKQLDVIQEEQVAFVVKIDREKQRREALDKSLEECRVELRKYRDLTRNGEINLDCAKQSAKQTNRLEFQLQGVKTKLSLARKENQSLKAAIDQKRRDKLLQVEILAKMVSIVLYLYYIYVCTCHFAVCVFLSV